MSTLLDKEKKYKGGVAEQFFLAYFMYINIRVYVYVVVYVRVSICRCCLLKRKLVCAPVKTRAKLCRENAGLRIGAIWTALAA